MTWLFDTCEVDDYGWCLRQYAVFSISIVVLGLSTYSCFKTFKLQHRITFELLPLGINVFCSLLLVGFYSQKQIYITRLILLLIEAYSYFILTYGFVFCVMKSTSFHREKLKNMKKIFIAATILALILLSGIIVIYTSQIKSCKPSQGITSIILLSIQIGLMIVVCIYGHRSKLPQIQTKGICDNNLSISEHLLSKQNHQIKLKNLQINLVTFAFVVALILQIMEIVAYYGGNPNEICYPQTNKIDISKAIDLYILCLQNIAQLFPHCIIPFIFWYVPAKIVAFYNTTYFLKRQTMYKTTKDSYKIIGNGLDSRLALDIKNEHYVRERMSPQKHQDASSQQ